MHRYVHRAGVGVIAWRQGGVAFVAATLARRDNHRRIVSRGRVVRGTATYGVVSSISRPTADVTTSGWTGNPDNVTLFNNLDETTASDTDYITSPTITGGENAIFTITPTLAAGTWDVRFRAQFVGSSAQVRITLLDGSNVSQGVSSWQTVTSTFALYTASVTTTGSAVRVKIEVQ